MLLPLLLGAWVLGAAPGTDTDVELALRHPDLMVAAGAAVRALDMAARADDDDAALEAVQRRLIAGGRHPLVVGLARRARADHQFRALRLAEAAADHDTLGMPRALRCAGPFDNNGGAAFATPTAVDDVAAALDAFLPVEREPRGAFDLDDQLVARGEVRVRCVVAVQATAPVAAIRLGGSGALAVWHGVERRPVVHSDADRTFGIDQVSGLVALPGGWSLLVVELAMLQRGGVLGVRATTPDGAPLRGLRWSTADADLRTALRAKTTAPTGIQLVDWSIASAPLADPVVAKATVALLEHTGAWDRRARPTAPDLAREAWIAGATSAGERALALVSDAVAHIDDDPSRARSRLREVADLQGLPEVVLAEAEAATAQLRDRQGDALGASGAWARARSLAPGRVDLAVMALAFERRRGVRGAPIDRAILAMAARSPHRPLHALAADVRDERGDVAGGLEAARRAGDGSGIALREAHIAEARLAIDPLASEALLGALRRRLLLHPGSHTIAERLTLLLLERGANDAVGALLAERRRRYPRRPEPLRLTAQVALLRGQRPVAAEALAEALRLTPDDGDLQRALRDLRDDEEDALVRRVPTFDAALIDAARATPPTDAAAVGAFIHHKAMATRFFDNGNLARVEDIVVVIVDARRADALRAFSFGYSGGRERLDVLGAERVTRDGRRETPERVLDRGQEGKENGVYSDARSKTVLFSTVEDGDVLHVRIRKETVGLQNQFGDFFGDIEIIDGVLPTRRLEVSIEGPSSRPLAWSIQGACKDGVDCTCSSGAPASCGELGPGVSAPTLETLPETTIWRFTATGLPALVGEAGMPAWLEVARYVSVSTYDDVAGLGAWYEALVADQLRLDDTLRGIAAREKAAAVDQRDLVRRLYEHVVTETRYVGIELGIHGWKPYPVTEVYRRRFGDCKDKASLLVALLREAAVPAHLALVRTTQLGHAATTPPSMWTFNHAIAWVEPLDLFLDGTAERSGLMELPTMDQGAAALIVDGQRSRLVTIPVAPAETNDNTSSYVLHIQRDGALAVDGDERFRGSHAARERQRFEDTAHQRQTLERELAQGIPGAQVTRIEVSDLALARAEVGYRFRGLLPQRADVDGDTLILPVSLYPHDLAGNYAEASARRFDLVVDHPWRTRNVMRYVLPPGMVMDALPAGGEVDTPHLRFRQVVTATSDGFIVDEDTTLRSVRIPVADYGAFREAAIAADRLMKRKLRIVPAGARR